MYGPRCGGDYPIVEGVLTTTIFGKGVAVAGMETACGASLIPSQFTDTVEWAGGGGASTGLAATGAAVAAARATGAELGLASSPAGQDTVDEAPARKITRMCWSYGPEETLASDVSRHYVDLNLHIELRAIVGADGTAKLSNVFRNKTLDIGRSA